jgi:hypothetical protein
MKKLLIIAIATIASINIHAQISITSGAGLVYTQDFNTLDTLASGNTFMPAGWAFAKSGTTATATNGMYKGWYGQNNTGDAYSLGSPGSIDRAFGSLASAGVRTTFGAIFINNTGATITSLNLVAKAEQWRKGDNFMTPDTTICSISSVATIIDSTLPGWVPEPLFNMYSTILDSTVPALGGTQADGNIYFNTINQTATLSIPAGSTFAIRWYDPNNQGSDDAIGLDDATFTFGTGTTAPITPIISSLVPADNSTNVAITTPITLNLSQAVTAGTGTIVLTNITDATIQTFTVPSAAVTIFGNSVSITGSNLVYGKDYAIAIDSLCFNNQGLNFAGIYNATTWNFTTASGPIQPLISSLTPPDNSINVPLSSPVSVTFTQPITAGSGVFNIHNITDATNFVINVPSANAVVTGSTVSFTGLTLLYGKDYAIQLDSACFNTAGIKIKGIYDDTTWNFKTANAPAPVTSLNETFTNCLFPVLGGFSHFSVVGAQTWRCSKFGHGDTSAAYVNGFSGGNLDNEDYLISPPLNLAAFTNPYIGFWSKVRFEAATTKELWVSNNYLGGNPNLAAWTNLNANLAALDTAYRRFGSLDLTPFKSSVMHVAFKYVSNTSAADEWSIDDVVITEGIPANIQTLILNNNQLAILGNAVDNKLNILLDSKSNDLYNLSLTDLNGKELYKTILNAKAGINSINVSIPTIANGLYILKVSNHNTQGVVKFTKL